MEPWEIQEIYRFDSEIERKLYKAFKRLGIQPATQYPVGVFNIDLAFPDIKLAVECDGRNYHSTQAQRGRDQFRQTILEQKGWKVERFPGWLINRHSNACAAKIALKYLDHTLTEEQRKRAMGHMQVFLARTQP